MTESLISRYETERILVERRLAEATADVDVLMDSGGDEVSLDDLVKYHFVDPVVTDGKTKVFCKMCSFYAFASGTTRLKEHITAMGSRKAERNGP